MTQGVLLEVAYDGTDYHGIAPQRDAQTVSLVLLEAIRRMAPEVAGLRIVSRTDAGVHAQGQLVCFDTERSIDPRGWVLGLAAYLPDAVAVRRSCRVPAGFDPRRHVLGKWYRYTLLQDRLRDPFVHRYAWKIRFSFDEHKARRAASHLIGKHDFAAYRSSADDREQTLRTIFDLAITRNPTDRRLIFVDVRGNAFMHNMVRIIVGTLVDIARGHLDVSVFGEAFSSKARATLGQTAPARGLSLQRVVLSANAPLSDCWPEKDSAHLPRWHGWSNLAQDSSHGAR